MGKFTYPDGSTPKICIVGAGFSGLTAAIKLKKELKLTSFQVFDENTDVGGTWLVNTYPGCACDVQSHMYSWSFEQNPDWSMSYSPQPEILEYIRKTARKYDLYPSIKFNSKVLKQEWQEEINQWKLTVLNKLTNEEEQLLFDIVINGPGALRVPSYPKEFESFKGPKCHTAEWDSSIDLENKVVGIVGSGASAVQVITDIAPKVKELICYQRKPAWITPRNQYEVSPTLRWLFGICPPLMWFYRWFLFLYAEALHGGFTQGHWLNKALSWGLTKSIRRQLPGQDVKATQLTPSYTVGCKRIVKSSEYYPALGLSHVKIITDKIGRVGRSEIQTVNGETQKLDVLILATGFQVQNYFDPMLILGKDGEDMMQNWKVEGPSSYYGICMSTAPNQFFLLGPNTALGHNSVLFMIECQMDFTIEILKELMKRNAKRVAVLESAEKEFGNQMEKKLSSTVWANGDCGSWYANAKGRITVVLWPSTCTRYWQETRAPDHSKFQYLINNNTQ